MSKKRTPPKRPRRLGQARGPEVTTDLPPEVVTPGKAGRPRVELSPEDYRQAETLAGYGLTNPKIAEVLGVAPRTMAERIRDDEEFAACLLRGRARAEAHVGEALFVLATGKFRLAKVITAEGKEATERIYTVRPDIQAIRWWEMTRAGRAERHQEVPADPTEVPMQQRVEEMEGIISLGKERARRAAGG